MTYKQLMQIFGGPSNAAKALGYPNRQRVFYWKKRGIPREDQALIEVITGGVLKADIRPGKRWGEL